MPVTPKMQQYLDMKEQYSDCILMFRLGDFYEMFFEDAAIASRELEIALTGRDCGLEERAPMCGVPYHAVDGYVSRLIANGHKVAICEQMEDPALAKGIVKREVIRVVTPGTVTDSAMLDEKKNNYLVSIYAKGHLYGFAVVDVSTGEFLTTRITWGNTFNKLLDETAKYSPAEIITNRTLYSNTEFVNNLKKRFNSYISPLDDQYFEYEFASGTISNLLGEGALEAGIDACVSSWQRFAPNTIPAGAKAGGNYLSGTLIAREARRRAGTLDTDEIMVITLSGRGDKDMHTVAQRAGIAFE